MFGRPDAPPPQPSGPSAESLETIEYDVLLPNGDTQTLSAHNAQIDCGCLVLLRVINANEDCTQQRIIPFAILAPGEWKMARTSFAGYKKSPLAI